MNTSDVKIELLKENGWVYYRPTRQFQNAELEVSPGLMEYMLKSYRPDEIAWLVRRVASA